MAIVGQCEASDQGHCLSALLASASIIEAPLVAREVVQVAPVFGAKSCLQDPSENAHLRSKV